METHCLLVLEELGNRVLQGNVFCLTAVIMISLTGDKRRENHTISVPPCYNNSLDILAIIIRMMIDSAL